jgi:hypothetical protein
VRVVDDAAAKEHFKARLTKFWPEDQVRTEQQAYADLGLVPEGTDLMAVLFDILEEQAGGYYDPESKTFFVLGDMPRATAPILMAHELTHALDDQHFDIDAIIEPLMEQGDRAAAVGAVLEGSGTVVMSLFVVREMTAGRLTAAALTELQDSEAGRAEKLKAAPQILQRALMGPYFLGQAFLMRGSLAGLMTGVPSEDLNRAFREPPVSTEQILHPEKYWDEDALDLPRDVNLGDLSGGLGGGWSLESSGELGELMLAILAGAMPINLSSPAAALPSTWTNEAASGWGGDRWQLYRRGDHRLTLLATLWDSEKDAKEFESALDPARGGWVIRRGDAVVLAAGDAPAGLAGKLGRAALKSLAAAPPPVTGE